MNTFKIFPILFCCLFLFIGSSNAQTPFNFNFRIYVNGTDYGYYSESTTHWGILTRTGGYNLPDLCPGDEITLRNHCSYNGSAYDFHSGSHFGRPTVGLTPQAGCSVPPTDYIPVYHLGDICDAADADYLAPEDVCSYVPSYDDYRTWPNWNQFNSITVVVPNNADSYSHLIVSAGFLANTVTTCGCGHRLAYLPLNFNASPTLIDNQEICAGDTIDLDLDPSMTYTNWNLTNPDGLALDTSGLYTVDITSPDGCTITDEFHITVHQPESDLLTITDLCFDESYLIESSDVSSDVSRITINGVIVYDLDLDGTGSEVDDLPHLIDAPTYGPEPWFGGMSGLVTIEYEYVVSWNPYTTCVKTYEIQIHPEILLDIQTQYDFCDSTFESICALDLVAQLGVSYEWAFNTVDNIVGTGSCFTPSGYGTYYVIATDLYGCTKTQSFTVINCCPPTNLNCTLSADGQTLSWDLIPGVSTYQISISYNDPNCCGNSTELPYSNLITVTGSEYIVPSLTSCFSWRVRSLCSANEVSNFSDPMCACGSDDACVLPSPINLNCSISDAGQLLTWDPVALASSYELVISYNDPNCCNTTEMPYSTLIPLAGTSYTLPSTTACFSWQVRALCIDGIPSNFSAIVCSCHKEDPCTTTPPWGLNCTLSPTGRLLSWAVAPGAVEYEVEIIYNDPACCPQGMPSMMRYTITGTSIDIPNPGRCFSWKVRSICSNGIKSPWSGVECACPVTHARNNGATNSILDAVDAVDLEIIVMPHPVQNQTTFSINSPILDADEVGTLLIKTIDGKQVYQSIINLNGSSLIDLSQLENGYYFYQIIHEKVSKSGKLVVRK